MRILLPRKKAIKFGEPRGIPLKKFPILKGTPAVKAKEIKKENTPVQRKTTSAKTKARVKAKALKEEITQKEVPSKVTTPKMSTKKKLLIIGLTISIVTITGYFIYKAQKNKN